MKASSIYLVDVLTAIQSKTEFFQCILANKLKALYVLPILAVDPEDHLLRVAKPTGRTGTPKTSGNWMVTIRDPYGAYQGLVREIVVGEDHLDLKVSKQMTFFARRRHLRFPLAGRSPIRVEFKFRGLTYQGQLADLSLDGLGIITEKNERFQVGESLTDLHFILRSKDLYISQVQIANLSFPNREDLRLGCALTMVPQQEFDLLRHGLNHWHLTQSPSYSANEES